MNFFTRGNWRLGFITHFDDFFCIICIVIRFIYAFTESEECGNCFQFINRERFLLLYMPRVCEKTGRETTHFPQRYTQQHKNIVILELDYSGRTRTRWCIVSAINFLFTHFILSLFLSFSPYSNNFFDCFTYLTHFSFVRFHALLCWCRR